MFSLFLRHSTEFCGIRIYREILDENAFSSTFYGILRNSTEFEIMKRFSAFFSRFSVISTEFA